MSRSKVTILSKYVMALAILALLFSVAITTSRYALQQSGSSTIGIESFDVDVKLLNSEGQEISGDISLDATTEDLSNYTETYYLDITNNDTDTLYYKIEEQTGNFCFAVGAETTRYTTYGGTLDTGSTELTLTVSLHPDVNVVSDSNQSLEIKLYAEYQHTEAYNSVEVTEPEPSPEPEPEQGDENHTEGWTALNSSNIGSVITGAGKYYLSDDITVSSTLTLASGTTLCLNGHTLTGSSSLNPLINITTGNVIVEDCQGNGAITGASTAINVAGDATLTLEGKPTISNNTTNVYLANGAYISLGELEEGANIGVTSATNITGSNSVQITSTETDTYNYESAIKYIHADNSEYKVASSHNGYLHLIGKEYINVTFAVEGTNDSKPSDTINDNDSNFDGNYYIEGFDGNWDHYDGSSWICTEALSEYKSNTYTYDLYYDMGLSGVKTSINFVISPYKWDSTMGGLGLGPDNSLTNISWDAEYNNFNLYATQASYVYVDEGEGAPYDYYDWSNWKLDFGSDYSSENGMTTILEGIGDFTIVLEVNFSSVTTVWGQVNNVVSGVYFIADGQKISLTTY